MAVLDPAQRLSVSKIFQSDASKEWEAITGLTKPDLLAAVNALDDFFETNKAAVNNALPEPAKSALTPLQKSRMLVYVIEHRYKAGS